MILKLRQRHRRTFAVLGLLVPIAFALGVAARRPVPLTASLASPAATIVWERADLFAPAPVHTRLLRTEANQFSLSLSAGKDFTKPDLIVYWAAGDPSLTDTVPENAILLGTFSAVSLPLPRTAVQGGVLILYSLADHEVVAISKHVTW